MKSFCFFLKFTFTIVDPDSATNALPGSQIISGILFNFNFSRADLISLK